MDLDKVKFSDHSATQLIKAAHEDDAFSAMADRVVAGDTQDWM